MKKQKIKKLAFKTETIRVLSTTKLERVAGGDSIAQTICLGGWCAPSPGFTQGCVSLPPGGGGGGGGGPSASAPADRCVTQN